MLQGLKPLRNCEWQYLFIFIILVFFATFATFQTLNNAWVQGALVPVILMIFPVSIYWNESLGIQESVFSHYYSDNDFEWLRLDCIEHDDRAAAKFLNAIKKQNRMITCNEVKFIGKHINETIRLRESRQLEEKFNRLLS